MPLNFACTACVASYRVVVPDRKNSLPHFVEQVGGEPTVTGWEAEFVQGNDRLGRGNGVTSARRRSARRARRNRGVRAEAVKNDGSATATAQQRPRRRASSLQSS